MTGLADWDAADLATLRRRRSYKWRTFGDAIPAFIAEMDYPLAPPIAEVLATAVAASDTGYSQPAGELAEAYAAFAAERHGWRVEPAAVSSVPDVMVGVIELLRRAVPPGAGVVITPPVYPPFFEAIAEAGCRVVEVPLQLSPGGRYGLDLERLEAAFGEADALLLCNPHNPTGRVLSRAELLAVADLAERHDVLVLSDEIHAPLVLDGAVHTPFLTLDHPIVERSAVLTSASKGWNIPGLKCALMVTGPGPMRRVVEGMPREIPLRCGHLGVIATIAAYRDGGPWLDELLGVLDRNRRLVAGRLAEGLPAAVHVPPEATFLAWIGLGAAGLGDEPAAAVLRHTGVAVGRGLDFGEPGRGFVRLTFATPLPILEQLLAGVEQTVAAADVSSRSGGR